MKLNVMLYGKAKSFFGLVDMLKSITMVKDVSVFEHLSLARKYLEQQTVDMILLDADDDTSGWQYLAGQIGKINRKIKIVLISRNIDEAVRAYEAGIFDYLLKPVKTNQLERVLIKSED